MHSTTRRIGAVAVSLALLSLLTLSLAACGTASTNPNAPANELDMGQASFVQTSRTISAGESLHFVDDPSGAMHVLCIGKDGHCDPNAQGPQALTGQGFTIQPGQSQDVRFDTAGTYPITCTIHPNMNMLVTVR